ELTLMTVEHDAANGGTLAYRWATSLIACGYVPMGPVELEAVLQDLADAVLKVAEAPEDPEPARAAGAALVRAHLTGPLTLSATVTVLGAGLPPGPSSTMAIAALAAGYAATLREVTLVQQERLARAIIGAQERTEHAARESEARFRAIFAGAA